MLFHKIIPFFSVGTRFIASIDLSSCAVKNGGYKRVKRVQGDESPDGINAVPTKNHIRFKFLNSIIADAAKNDTALLSERPQMYRAIAR
jgi:hypothetical protein